MLDQQEVEQEFAREGAEANKVQLKELKEELTLAVPIRRAEIEVEIVLREHAIKSLEKEQREPKPSISEQIRALRLKYFGSNS